MKVGRGISFAKVDLSPPNRPIAVLPQIVLSQVVLPQIVRIIDSHVHFDLGGPLLRTVVDRRN